MSRLAKPPPGDMASPPQGPPRTPKGPGQHPPEKRWDTRPPGLGRSLPAVGGLSVWLCRPQGQLVTSCEGPLSALRQGWARAGRVRSGGRPSAQVSSQMPPTPPGLTSSSVKGEGSVQHPGHCRIQPRATAGLMQ